ncbi:pentapeptide repeat-containing protein [Nocardia nova]
MISSRTGSLNASAPQPPNSVRPNVAVRIAGVYAMAGVADESDGLRRQQCIDVLCGYLRLPYDPDQGNTGRTKRVVTTPTTRPAEGLDPGKVEDHHEYRQNDREVRATIVRVVAAHLRPTAAYSWSLNDFDFRTAHLEHIDLTSSTFLGAAWFGGATFSGPAEFGRATFSGPAEFAGATFSDTARFAGARFSGPARFDRATFSGETDFRRVDFGAEVVSFADPEQWGPPAPMFDWDKDVSQKPANVEPRDWPPVTTTNS